jgi:hypothetical protein
LKAYWAARAGLVGNWKFGRQSLGQPTEMAIQRPLWNKTTGKIDHEVATYMRDQGYDLRYYAEANWPRIGPKLVGKLHLYCGDMDNFYLNLGVYLLEDFLKNTKEPFYDGSFEYGRPMKGHGWQPMTNAELIKIMADQIAKNAPKGAGIAWNGD